MATQARYIWRIYGGGAEFGIDFASLDEARRMKALYRRVWPDIRYYIRRHRLEAAHA